MEDIRLLANVNVLTFIGSILPSQKPLRIHKVAFVPQRQKGGAERSAPPDS